MDMNLYWVEKHVASKLAEARAESTRRALRAALRADQPGALAGLGLALIRIGRWLRHRGSPRRRAGGVPLPSLR